MKKLMIICVLVALAMAVLDATYCEKVEPDGVFPMANQHITWMHEKKPLTSRGGNRRANNNHRRDYSINPPRAQVRMEKTK